MALKPLGDWIVVEPLDLSEEMTAGGIVVPDAHRARPLIGIVVATGPGHWRTEMQGFVPTQVDKGQRVLYSSYAGQDLQVDGKELLVMREHDVILVFDETSEVDHEEVADARRVVLEDR
jgi:chaperonin GroES